MARKIKSTNQWKRNLYSLSDAKLLVVPTLICQYILPAFFFYIRPEGGLINAKHVAYASERKYRLCFD